MGGRNTGFLPDIDALKGALHIHNIQPSLKLVADLPCDANFAKTQRFVQLDRAGISRIANNRHHLFKALFLASGDKGRQQFCLSLFGRAGDAHKQNPLL